MACLAAIPHEEPAVNSDVNDTLTENFQPDASKSGAVNSFSTTSVYHSAYNVFDKQPPSLRKQSSDDRRGQRRQSSGPDSGHFKLVQGKLCIEHFLMDLTFDGNYN